MQEELNKTLNILEQGGVIVYPTDTIWGIGCDATNVEAIKKIYKLKQREESKSMISLVCDVEMLSNYVQDIPTESHSIIENSIKPTTIIYDNPVNVAPNIIADDNTLAIRIINEGFAHELIKMFNKPIVSTSANISGQPSPKSFKEIDQQILKGVEYVVNLPHLNKDSQASAIVKITNDGTVKYIRE